MVLAQVVQMVGHLEVVTVGLEHKARLTHLLMAVLGQAALQPRVIFLAVAAVLLTHLGLLAQAALAVEEMVQVELWQEALAPQTLVVVVVAQEQAQAHPAVTAAPVSSS